MPNSSPPRPASLAPGYDEEDPYEGEDLSTYPRWWRRNIKKFQEYGLRPYRPPRFVDGEYVPEMVTSLEAELQANIRFQVVNPQENNDWELVVDGETITSVEKYREPEGYSLYELTSDEFETLIREAVTEDN